MKFKLKIKTNPKKKIKIKIDSVDQTADSPPRRAQKYSVSSAPSVSNEL